MHKSEHLARKAKEKAAVFGHKRRLALALSLVLILAAAVGGTLAYLMDTDSSASGFTVGKVSCSVSVADDQRSVTVSNTGNVSSNVRVALVANWVGEKDSSAIHYTQPQISAGDASEWSYNEADGYYYCNNSVGAGSSVTLGISVQGAAPAGYRLQITALAEAIQPGAAADAWGYSPLGN